MKTNNLIWNKIYKDRGLSYVSGSTGWGDVVKLLKKKQMRNILDVGCGTGAHLLELAKDGFQVTGIDVSTTAINLARSTFKKQHEVGKFYIGNIHKKLPFKTGSFDAVICLRTLNHGNFKEIKATAGEMQRVLKKDGIAYISVQKFLGFRGRKGEQVLNNLNVIFVEDRTYIKQQGEEKGIKHFLMSKKILLRLFNRFRVVNFWISYGKEKWEKYYCLLALKSKDN